MKLFMGLLVLVSMYGCGAADRFGATVTGNTHVCVDGVEYLQFTSGVSVAYNVDGTIKRCK